MMVYRWVALAWAPALVCGGRELPTNSRGGGARLPAAAATNFAAASEEDQRVAEMMALFIFTWDGLNHGKGGKRGDGRNDSNADGR